MLEQSPKPEARDKVLDNNPDGKWEMLVFEERGKPEYPEKSSWSKDKNPQQTQPICDAKSGNQTLAALVEGECSSHCAILAPPPPQKR